ncbi:hypothetical protein ABNP32_13435 [Pseudomonas viridiflava]
MPIRTAFNDLLEGLKVSLHSYWMIRAANSAMIAFSQNELWTKLMVDFQNVPSVSGISPPPSAQFGQLRLEIEKYVTQGRASTDFFLTMISQFETFLSAALQLKGASTEGTLGNLISRAASNYSISDSLESQVIAEIRERRNAIIHHHGKAGPRYLQAASANFVAPTFGHAVQGQQLVIDDGYLAHVVDGLIDYARKFI